MLASLKPLLPLFLAALGGWALIRVCRFVYRANRRMVKGRL